MKIIGFPSAPGIHHILSGLLVDTIHLVEVDTFPAGTVAQHCFRLPSVNIHKFTTFQLIPCEVAVGFSCSDKKTVKGIDLGKLGNGRLFTLFKIYPA
ncbi:MAG: hypothetical protein QGH96_12160 [Desulfobacterales bacterium]|nr:hypothetical protein [Desulfobacterales bacterium]